MPSIAPIAASGCMAAPSGFIAIGLASNKPIESASVIVLWNRHIR